MKTLVSVDQSYEETGLAVVNSHGDVLWMGSLKFSRALSRSKRRSMIARRVLELVKEYKAEKVIVEHVRLFSSQRSAKQRAKKLSEGREDKHISLPVIVAHSRIIGSILDVLEASEVDIPVYSIDTQVWKNTVLDSRLATKNDAVWYVEQITHQKVGHNIADAICIGIAGWNSRITQYLEQ